MIQVYRSTDSSAPVLNGMVGSLVGLLKACLVHGYGAGAAQKASLGWAIDEHADGLKAAFYSQDITSGQPILFMDDTGPGAGGGKFATALGIQATQWLGFDSSGVPLYDPGKSFPTLSQSSFGSEFAKSLSADAVARDWILLGDSKTFYLFVDWTSRGFATLDNDVACHGFGDLVTVSLADQGLGFLTANMETANSTIPTFTGLRWTLGNITPTEALIDVGNGNGALSDQRLYKIAVPRFYDKSTAGGLGTGTMLVHPINTAGGLYVEDVPIVSGPVPRQLRGFYPGLLTLAHEMPLVHDQVINGIAGRADRDYLVINAATAQRRGQLLIDITGPW